MRKLVCEHNMIGKNKGVQSFCVDTGFSWVSLLHGSYFSVETVTFQIRAHLKHI